MDYRETQGRLQSPLFEGEETDFRWLLLVEPGFNSTTLGCLMFSHPWPFDVF
jgi:hypothetical protein